MLLSDIRWTDHGDRLGEKSVSQRLRYAAKDSPRVYVYRWGPNHFTIMEIGKTGLPSYAQGLDALDVNVRLLKLQEDQREHRTFSTLEPR